MDTPLLIENDTLRESLVSYYKWIVNLAIFVLTLSITIFELINSERMPSWMIIAGWICLSICIFFNWLLINRLVKIPIVYEAFEQNEAVLFIIYLSIQ